VAADQKRGRRKQASIVFLDECGFQLQPLNRRTWAPRGETPVQVVSARYDRLSVIGALALSPQRRRIGLYFDMQDDNIRTADVVRFLRRLHRHLKRRIILVLDRWSVHRSAVKQLLAAGASSWLEVEWLPAYAPELNPVEPLWSHTKYSDLANFVPEDLWDLEDRVAESLCEQYDESALKRSFFQASGLAI